MNYVFIQLPCLEESSTALLRCRFSNMQLASLDSKARKLRPVFKRPCLVGPFLRCMFVSKNFNDKLLLDSH